MDVTLYPSVPNGKISAIASKSEAHRLIICASFADKPTQIRCEQTNRDIEATVRCMTALGAKIGRYGSSYTVEPIKEIPRSATLYCGESGSTLRFLLPVAAALGIKARFVLEGRLPERPLSPLREELEAHGVTLSSQGSNPLICEGRLNGESFSINGNVSSQFISGLLFALALCKKGGTLTVKGRLESAPYVNMTLDALSKFGINVAENGYEFTVPNAKAISPEIAEVEGDWSNAAFPLCAAAIRGEVTVSGVYANSHQGDKAVTDILRRFGAVVVQDTASVTVRGGKLCGTDIDATQIPDLVPVLASVAAFADGTTRIYGASRLRLKESDRLLTVRKMLSSLGADISETEDGLIIVGKPCLLGGSVSAEGDHRIAMSASVASVGCSSSVTVNGAEAVEKSYPSFFEDIKRLGFSVTER